MQHVVPLRESDAMTRQILHLLQLAQHPRTPAAEAENARRILSEMPARLRAMTLAELGGGDPVRAASKHLERYALAHGITARALERDPGLAAAWRSLERQTLGAEAAKERTRKEREKAEAEKLRAEAEKKRLRVALRAEKARARREQRAQDTWERRMDAERRADERRMGSLGSFRDF